MRSDEGMRPVVETLLAGAVLVDDVDAAVAGHRQAPQLTWVTRSGDVVSRGTLRGGSGAQDSLVEVRAAYEHATAEVEGLTQRSERLRFDLAAARDRQEAASGEVEAALKQLQIRRPTRRCRRTTRAVGADGAIGAAEAERPRRR